MKVGNILSLFDGISSGQIALNRAAVKYENYFASEIDKKAIEITQKNYPHTVQLGDVAEIKGKALPKIDLLLAGSPCQGFSIAGKQLNFEDSRSKLFFEFVRILKETKPEYFLLENVKMKREYQDIITSYVGVEPVKINSALVSAQSRERLYWTNIPLSKIQDKGIVIKDILDDNDLLELPAETEIFLNGKKVYTVNKKSKYLKQIGYIMRDSQSYRIYDINGKSPTLISTSGGLAGRCNALINDWKIRRFSLSEIERLQTLPVGYTRGAKKNDRLHAIGNGWTVDVIKEIFLNLNKL